MRSKLETKCNQIWDPTLRFGNVDLFEFKNGLKIYKIALSKSEMELVFNAINVDKTQFVSIEKIVDWLLLLNTTDDDQLSIYRRTIVNSMFNRRKLEKRFNQMWNPCQEPIDDVDSYEFMKGIKTAKIPLEQCDADLLYNAINIENADYLPIANIVDWALSGDTTHHTHKYRLIILNHLQIVNQHPTSSQNVRTQSKTEAQIVV